MTAPIQASASETKNQSDASSAKISSVFDSAFGFDDSGWNINFGTTEGPMTASGSTGQNAGTGGGMGAGMTPNMRMLLIGLAAYYILRK